jgi:hypothetical protein
VAQSDARGGLQGGTVTAQARWEIIKRVSELFPVKLPTFFVLFANHGADDLHACGVQV